MRNPVCFVTLVLGESSTPLAPGIDSTPRSISQVVSHIDPLNSGARSVSTANYAEPGLLRQLSAPLGLGVVCVPPRLP